MSPRRTYRLPLSDVTDERALMGLTAGVLTAVLMLFPLLRVADRRLYEGKAEREEVPWPVPAV